MNRVCLGLDSSTQSLTGLAVECDAPGGPRVAAVESVRFDDELPQWGTQDGQLPRENSALGLAPPLLWIHALETLLPRLGTEVDLSRTAAIAVSGQQHGTVYLKEQAAHDFAHMDPQRPLHESLASALAREVAPIWTDSSTTAQCAAIRSTLGGAVQAAQLTGSDVYERFSGPQIRKFAETEPELWADTAHVTLVSSFLTSVLLGALAPLDWGDAAGTNLFDLRARAWCEPALDATAPDLARRLPTLEPAGTPAGHVSPALAARFAIAPEARVVVGTGDNPASSLGVGLLEPGDTTVSLGTSDTLASLGRQLEPIAGGHLFVAPTGDDLALLCFRNGSLVREHVRRAASLDGWEAFDDAATAVAPGNEGHVLLPWLEPEIVPRTQGTGLVFSADYPQTSAPHLARGVLEGQALTMKRYAGAASRILLTGGASASGAMPQILADVFDCPVLRAETPHGAALGAALLAARAILEPGPWVELVRSCTSTASGDAVHPRTDTRGRYVAVEQAQRALEQRALATRSA